MADAQLSALVPLHDVAAFANSGVPAQHCAGLRRGRLGFQMMLAALLALMFRGSVFASAVGTFAGNPLTYPLIWISTFTVGNVFLGSSANAEISKLSTGAQALGRSLREASPDGVATAVEGLWPILKPMAIGSLPLGGLTALVVYFFVRHLLDARKAILLSKAELKAAALTAGRGSNR